MSKKMKGDGGMKRKRCVVVVVVGGVKSGTWKEEGTERKREHLVLIDTDRDCNECGGGTAP